MVLAPIKKRKWNMVRFEFAKKGMNPIRERMPGARDSQQLIFWVCQKVRTWNGLVFLPLVIRKMRRP